MYVNDAVSFFFVIFTLWLVIEGSDQHYVLQNSSQMLVSRCQPTITLMTNLSTSLWHSQGVPGPYPVRIRQILVKMHGTNPDKMGPKCLETQIDDPDRNARKYYRMCINLDKYEHGEFFFGSHSRSSYLSLRLTTGKDLILCSTFPSYFVQS